MKLKARNPRKQSLTEDVTGQVEHNRIAGSAGNVFRNRLEVKLSYINAAQQAAREFSLVHQLFAALERQGRARLFLCERKAQSAREHYREGGDDSRIPFHKQPIHLRKIIFAASNIQTITTPTAARYSR